MYLAGPEVFLPDAAAVAAAKQRICARHGLLGVHPLDAETGLVTEDLAAPDRGLALYDALVDQLDGCTAGIANLTPFRGPSADVGTAWEVGYLLGRGRPVVAYTNVTTHYAARVEPDGLQVEAHDLADNLMLEGAVRRSSGLAVVRVATPDAVRFTALDGFERCAVALAELLGAG